MRIHEFIEIVVMGFTRGALGVGFRVITIELSSCRQVTKNNGNGCRSSLTSRSRCCNLSLADARKDAPLLCVNARIRSYASV